jgi:hypothetical protein
MWLLLGEEGGSGRGCRKLFYTRASGKGADRAIGKGTEEIRARKPIGCAS